ncbi:hypothetical protein HMPREF1617_04720 [Escherichia coli 908675]|nr:hypothetical protein HMPREF1604_00535 [Escherichia coli 908519]ESE10095.1 hypothetical protein HMPREF1617_04720 [Escherichia coli 908675]
MLSDLKYLLNVMKNLQLLFFYPENQHIYIKQVHSRAYTIIL